VRWLLDNLGLKLVSLGLALVLWFVIAGEKTSEMGVMAQLELQNFPRDLELTGDLANVVEVRVRASPEIIQRLQAGDVSARVDLAGTVEGERIVHLSAESIRVPFGVTVVKVAPSTLTLNFERTRQRTVPIRPRVSGRPAPGYELAELTSEPGEVLISGPRSRVEGVESAYTEPVAIDKAEMDVVDEVNLGLDDPMLRLQGARRVRVTARIREQWQTRRLEGLPVQVRNGSGSARPERVAVVLKGPASVVKSLAAGDVTSYVDAAQAGNGGRLAVAVEVASGHAGVEVAAVEPAEVTLVRARRGAARAGSPKEGIQR
jgi:YbbR domain-containing protein